MSILSSILEKLGFGSANASPQPAPDTSAAPPTGDSATGTTAPASEKTVQGELAKLKKDNPGLNPDTSIVDLLKALGMDSSFEHRKELAKEVGIDPYDGSAGQNIQLHEAVLKKAAQ